MKTYEQKNEEYKKELDEYLNQTDNLKAKNKVLLIFLYFVGWLIFMLFMYFSE